MVKFIDRSGNPIDWSNINISTFPTDQIASGVYGVDNIIDIMFLGVNGECLSVSPAKYKEWYGTYTNNAKDANWIPDHHSNEREPITFRNLTENDMRDHLCPLAKKNQAGAWQNTSNTGRYLSGYDFDVAKFQYPKDMKPDWTVTKFYALYYQISNLTHMMQYGYKMFRPDNFNHYQNWAGYESSHAVYRDYMIVAYLTLPNLLQTMAFLRGSDIGASIKSLARVENNAVINLVNDTCSSEYPSSSILSVGYHHAGTTIYSPNTEYKFVVQVDGNCVVYKYDGTAVWSTNTHNPAYVFPKLVIDSDGYTRVEGTRKNFKAKPISHTISKHSFLHLNNNGILSIIDYQYNIPRWSSVAHSVDLIFDTSNVIKSYHTFMPGTTHEAKNNVIKYSPSMSHYLKFTSDGVLELHRSASIAVSPPIKDTIIWDTSDKTKGRPNAILSIGSDGLIKITDGNHNLWDTVKPINSPVFLVADDNGYAVMYNDNGYKGSYSYPRWNNADKFYQLAPANHPARSSLDVLEPILVALIYNQLATGVKDKINTNPQSFSRACSNANYSRNLNKNEIRYAQARYCASGLNLITDSQCSDFMSEENKNSDTEAAFQKFIIPRVNEICADGYDTRYASDSAMQTRINDFCSCKNPVGENKKIADKGHHPICFNQKCIENGYKSSNAIRSKSTCPKSICIQDINVSNLQLVKGFDISCNASSTPTPTTSTPAATTGGTTSTPPPTPIVEGPASVFNDDNLFSSLYEYGGKNEAYRLSPNGKYRLVFQSDGNLVLYTTGSNIKPIWASNTSINPSAILTFESNGNLQIYSDSTKSKSLWSSKTGNDYGNPVLVVDNNGAAVIYQIVSEEWIATWSSIGLDKYLDDRSITINYTGQADNRSKSSDSNLIIIISVIVGVLVMIAIAILIYKKSKHIQPMTRPFTRAPTQFAPQPFAPVQQQFAPTQFAPQPFAPQPFAPVQQQFAR